MVLSRKFIILVVGLVSIFIIGGIIFIWLYNPARVRKACTLTGGILKEKNAGLLSCIKSSADAYQPCSSSEQCKNGCFFSSSESQIEKMCQVYNANYFGYMYEDYLCPADAKLEGECAPLDRLILTCSESDFFDRNDYQLVGKGKVMPVFLLPSYACEPGNQL